MTATLLPQSEITTQSVVRPSLWKTGLKAGLLAAVATTAIAVVASAAGVSFEVEGEAIPMAGYAQMTLIGAVVGILLATSLRRWAKHPQSTFVRTTVALTALSVVPDLTMGFDAGSAATLIVAHVVAATIIIPAWPLVSLSDPPCRTKPRSDQGRGFVAPHPGFGSAAR